MRASPPSKNQPMTPGIGVADLSAEVGTADRPSAVLGHAESRRSAWSHRRQRALHHRCRAADSNGLESGPARVTPPVSRTARLWPACCGSGVVLASHRHLTWRRWMLPSRDGPKAMVTLLVSVLLDRAAGSRLAVREGCRCARYESRSARSRATRHW